MNAWTFVQTHMQYQSLSEPPLQGRRGVTLVLVCVVAVVLGIKLGMLLRTLLPGAHYAAALPTYSSRPLTMPMASLQRSAHLPPITGWSTQNAQPDVGPPSMGHTALHATEAVQSGFTGAAPAFQIPPYMSVGLLMAGAVAAVACFLRWKASQVCLSNSHSS